MPEELTSAEIYASQEDLPMYRRVKFALLVGIWTRGAGGLADDAR
jgi:hypothetical protein